MFNFSCHVPPGYVYLRGYKAPHLLLLISVFILFDNIVLQKVEHLCKPTLVDFLMFDLELCNINGIKKIEKKKKKKKKKLMK